MSLFLAIVAPLATSTLRQQRPVPDAGVPSNSVVTGFGTGLAVLGDVNGDKVPDLAIGAPYDSGNGKNAGCVFVVSGRDGKHLLRLGGRRSEDFLGTSVRSGADLDGDGLHDVIAEAEERTANGIVLDVSLRFFSSRDGRELAGIPRDTAFAGTDLDGDGVEDSLSAQVDVDAHVISGKDHRVLRVFHEQRPGGYLEGFGSSVAWAGDVDGDAVPDVGVGCSERGDSGDEYYVALFSGRDARVIRTLDSDGKMTVVAEGKDFDGDGIPDLPIGLPEEDLVVVLDGRRLRASPLGTVVRRVDWPALLTLRRGQYPSERAPIVLPTPSAGR